MAPKKFVTVSARMHEEKRIKFDELLGHRSRNEFINEKIEEFIDEPRGTKTVREAPTANEQPTERAKADSKEQRTVTVNGETYTY